jgi:hypothetical protein
VSQGTYRLSIVRLDSRELELIGNRAGLKDFAGICQGLIELSDDQAKTSANRYHIADYLNMLKTDHWN